MISSDVQFTAETTAAIARARDIKQWAVLDDGEETFRRDFDAGDRMVLPLRSDLYESLIATARDAFVWTWTGIGKFKTTRSPFVQVFAIRRNEPAMTPDCA